MSLYIQNYLATHNIDVISSAFFVFSKENENN